MNVDQNLEIKDREWVFSGNTPNFFDDHIEKSVPFYRQGHDLILQMSEFFIHNDTICYELGCSTGALTSQLATKYINKQSQFVGIDIEPEMIKKAKQGNGKKQKNLQFQCEDITKFDFLKSDLIIAYYTVQFIPPYKRQQLLNKIYESLNWGGAFLLFEKVRAPDARFQDQMSTIYTEFKLNQGFNASEIINKNISLKRVLEPFSTQGNIDLLKRAGFVDIMSIFKYVSFEGFLCIK